MITSELAAGVTGTTLDAPTADVDPVLAHVKALSGRSHLPPVKARQRYALVLRWLDGDGGRPQSDLAKHLDCTTSNVSRIVQAARRALAASEGAIS